MVQQQGAALWQFSCVAFVVVTLIACAAIAIGGRAVGLPVIGIWFALVLITLATMLASMRLASGEARTEEAIEESPSAPAPAGIRFNDWLVDAMTAHGISTVEIAMKLEVRDDLVEEWLAGRQAPTPVQCARLAALLDIPERTVLRVAGWVQ